jgi:ribose 5-phosphate isomerase B
MKIHLATDHAGFAHKEAVKAFLTEQGIEVVDHGASSFEEGDDYPDYVAPAAVAVAQDQDSMGIIFGHSGEGEAMVANRLNGVRAVVYYGGAADILTLSREHNAANVLSIGTGFIAIEDTLEAVKLWLETPFSNEERHVRRLNKF